METGNIFLGSQERTSFEVAVLVSGANVLFLLWMKDPEVNWVVSDIMSLSTLCFFLSRGEIDQTAFCPLGVDNHGCCETGDDWKAIGC